MLLKGSRNRRLSRGRESSEPYGAAPLLAVFVALTTGQTRVPGNITVGGTEIR